jgi:hypothetical protein
MITMAMQVIVPTEEETAELIKGTNQEIFDDAMNNIEDENNGDDALEQMDEDWNGPGETEEGDEPDEIESEDPADYETDETEEEIDAAAKEDGEEPEPTRSEDQGRIPSSRLREETERRRAIEQERDTLRAQLAAFQVSQQQRQQPQQEQPAKPDIWSDPEAWAAQQQAQFEQRMVARHVQASLVDAQEQHGEEFDAAYKALTSLPQGDPIARATVQRIWDAPNPGKALMRWNGEQQILRQAGGDPSAYKQSVAKELMSDPEFRRQMLAEMRGEAERGDGGRPRTTTRLPKSLNGASGGGSVRTGDPELYNDSEASAFAFAMK